MIANQSAVAAQVADLGSFFLSQKDDVTPACLSLGKLDGLAAYSLAELPSESASHIAGCPRCASVFTSLRGSKLVQELPRQWSALLGNISIPPPGRGEPFQFQTLGRIDLEERTYKPCASELEWLPHPTYLRTNLVVDQACDLFNLTVLDVPDPVDSIALAVAGQQKSMERVQPAGTYALMAPLSVLGSIPEESALTVSISLTFCMEPIFPGSQVADVLRRAKAVEEGYDYVLPSGLHCGVHINMGEVCKSEVPLEYLAQAFNALFRETKYDTILAHGWAMGTIAHRLARLRMARDGRGLIREIMTHGYQPPMLAQDVPSGASVLVLVDVVVTGNLVRELQKLVNASGAQVADVGAVVQASREAGADRAACSALCELDLRMVDIRQSKCPRCDALDWKVFNPFSCSMTVKTSTPRSVSQFLGENPDVLDFWEKVNRAGAYQYHKVERNAHYLAFVNTRRLVEHPGIGPGVVASLAAKILAGFGKPDIVLVPNLVRAKSVGRLLMRHFQESSPPGPVTLLGVNRRHGRFSIPEDKATELKAARVLVVDSGAGFGRTLDELSLLAADCEASRVSCAVVVSRLTETCEKALDARLTGGFYYSCRIPIPKVEIRGASRELCPYCQRKAAVRELARESKMESIKRWAESLDRPPFRGQQRSTRRGGAEESHVQLGLFGQPSILERCSAPVASGVTLHAFYAGKNNGMAPLALPELVEGRIRARNRAAMIENLPVGAVGWSGGSLKEDLERTLASRIPPSVWRATAEALAKEHYSEWAEHLPGLLERSRELRCEAQPRFWSCLTSNAYVVSRADPQESGKLRVRIDSLLSMYSGTAAQAGLRDMRDAVSQAAAPQL